MITDALYDIAFQFKKAKLWEKLFDTELFAVAYPDGTIGYCCVMGMMGEHLALAVYLGDEGLNSYRMMGRNRFGMDEFELHEITLSQNCCMLSFEGKEEMRPRELSEVRAYCKAHGIALRGKSAYPRFQRFQPSTYPWYLDDEADQVRLIEALQAGIEVSNKLKALPAVDCGFTDGAPFDRTIPLLRKGHDGFTWDSIALPPPSEIVYASPEIYDDIGLAKLAKVKKRGGEWACDIFMHVMPISDEKSNGDEDWEPNSAPFFPFALLLVDVKSNLVLNAFISSQPKHYEDQFAKEVLEVVQQSGRPSRILVSNKRAHAFFDKLSTQLGAELVLKEHIPCLEEAKMQYLQHFDGDKEDFEDAMDEFMEELRDPEVLEEMPDSMLMQLQQISRSEPLPEDIAENVKRECAKRGIKLK